MDSDVLFIGGFVYASDALAVGKRIVTVDVLPFSTDATILEIDSCIVEKNRYDCSMILIEEYEHELLCDRRRVIIHFFKNRESAIHLLAEEGCRDLSILLEEEIGIPGLRAFLISAII